MQCRLGCNGKKTGNLERSPNDSRARYRRDPRFGVKAYSERIYGSELGNWPTTYTMTLTFLRCACEAIDLSCPYPHVWLNQMRRSSFKVASAAQTGTIAS